MRLLVRAARGALGSGRFVTVWSLAASVVLSATVMVPPVGDPTRVRVIAALVAGWLCFAGCLLVVGVLERAVRRPRARAAIVAAGVVAAAAIRPGAHDLWMELVGVDAPAPAQLPYRIVTNVVVWAVVLTAVAVVVDALRSLRATNALLLSVRDDLDAARRRRDEFDASARAVVAEASADLRSRIHALREAPHGGDAPVGAIRAVGERCRAWSHTLAERAATAVAAAGAPDVAGRADARPGGRRRRGWPPLRPAAPGTVTVLYVACMLPYALRAVTPSSIAVALTIVVVGGWAVDRGCRLRTVHRRRGAPAAVFLALSTIVGAALSAEAAASGRRAAESAVPVVVYVGLCVGAALCAGVVHRLRVEQRRLAGAITAERFAARSATAASREALSEASHLMHRDGQGGCVVFAIEHPNPTVTQRLAFAAGLDRVVDRMERVFEGPSAAVDAAAFDELVDTWARAIAVTATVSARAREVLDTRPRVAAAAFEIAAEGLLNAAKHAVGAAATLGVDVVDTGAGERLRVAVFTPGLSPAPAALRPASRARRLGAHLRTAQTGMLLEAAIAVVPPVSAVAVVSAEHRTAEARAEP